MTAVSNEPPPLWEDGPVFAPVVEPVSTNGHHDPEPPPPDPFVDWAGLWADDGQADWLYDDVLALGRGHALYAAHKLGKSLFMLWVAARLATGTRPVAVVYLDYEMTEDDLRERLDDMGYGPDTDLSRLRYALLPSLPPLNTPEGGTALLQLVDQVQEHHPGHQILVVVDTTSRAVVGEENASNPYMDFYRWTGLRLKQRGHTFIRLDHAGKDPTKGQRGSSAKGDDVDLVWKMAKTDDGIELRRELSRIAWAPIKVPFRMTLEPLSYEPVPIAVPAGTKETIDRLDALNVAADASCTEAQAALRANGPGRRRGVVMAAQRSRRARAERSPS